MTQPQTTPKIEKPGVSIRLNWFTNKILRK